MRWFGRSWGAPINKSAEQMMVAPFYKNCHACSQPIQGSQGFEIPYAHEINTSSLPREEDNVYWSEDLGHYVIYNHYECFMQQILPGRAKVQLMQQ